MKKTLVLLAFAMASVMAFAAPAPYPVTVNSRALTAPPLIAYRGNECVYRVYFTDGDAPSSISNATPFLAWSTNNNAAVNVTSSYSVVNVASGIVDFTFSPASLNYTPGRYVYEVGVYNGNARVYRQGIFTIVGSPVGQGVGSVTWSTNVSWAAVNWIGAPTITIGDQSGSIKTSLVFSSTGAYVLRNNGASTNQSLVGATVADKLSFNMAFTDALVAGQIAYDPDWQTFRAGLPDGVTGQFFQESQIYAKNASGQVVTNGMAVMQSDAVGNSSKLEFVLALASVGTRPSMMLGVATHDIPVGAFGKITWFGNVNEINTTGALYGESGWTNNMPIYVSTNKPGFLTRYAPEAPYPRIFAGAVGNAHANVGNIFVKPTWGMSLADLDDVDGTPLTATGQFPVYDSVRGVFDFNRNVSEFLLASAFGTWTSTNKVSRLSDLVQPLRYFTALENGTGTVYETAGPYTNFAVTLSSDFLELDTNTRPAWTNNVFPFTDGDWLGFESSGSFYITHSGGAVWEQPGTAIPATLSAVNIASGYALVTVSNTYYTTNAVRHFATETELAQAKAECGLAMTNLVIAATNALMPYTQTVYGDFTTTNEAGYAAFVSANPGTQKAVAFVPGVTSGTNSLSFSYALGSIGRAASATLVAYAQLPSGTTFASSTLTLYDANGTPVSSNYFSATPGLDVTVRPYYTNSVAIPYYASNGTLRVIYTAGSSSTGPAKSLLTGGATPMTLSVVRVPTPYATVGDFNAFVRNDSGTATNLTIAGGNVSGDTLIGAQAITNVANNIVKTLSVSPTNVVISATNAVYYVALTNAANVSFDFSALSLGGAKHASATVYLDCLNTQALASVFNTNSVTFDMPWEPTVTGRYEIAVSFDGIRTTARQAWPKNDTAQFGYVKYNYAGTSSTFPNLSAIADGSTNGAVYTWVSCPNCMYAVRAQFSGGNAGDTVTFGYYRFVLGYADFISPFVAKTIINPGSPYGFSSGWVIVPSPTPTWLGGPGFANGVGLWVTRSSSTAIVRCTVLEVRKANALEIKAAQAMGL